MENGLLETGRIVAAVVAVGYFVLAWLTVFIGRRLYRAPARPWMYMLAVSFVLWGVWEAALAIHSNLRPTPAWRIFSRMLHIPSITALLGGFWLMYLISPGVKRRGDREDHGVP